MREKIVRHRDCVEVIYDDSRWRLLENFRTLAIDIMKKIPFESFVHGSVARGDVSSNSDIDIVIPYPVSTYQIEAIFENIYDRVIVMATPNSVPKAHIYLDERISITIPLVNMSRREEDFYKFSGRISLTEIMNGVRVVGVNKKLLLIEPTSAGHREFSIIGKEMVVAKILNLDVDVVEERVRVLTRRDKIGRTGVFLKVRVPDSREFEEYLEEISYRNPAVKRILEER